MKIFINMIIFCLLTGCVTYNDYYKLNNNHSITEQYKTKYINVDNEDIILASATKTLQDLGFIIYETESKLGLIAAYKNENLDFSTYLKQTTDSIVSDIAFSSIQYTLFNKEILENDDLEFDIKYKTYATIVSTKNKNKPGYNVKIGFYKITWTNLTGNMEYGNSIEVVKDKSLYTDFFEKLNYYIFLTINDA